MRVAASTKWTEWGGLPGSENLTKTLREYKWGAPSETKGKADEVKTALASAAKTISSSYEQPYVRHAPIGPFVAVADVRRDGSVDGVDAFGAIARTARANRVHAERARGKSGGALAGTIGSIRAYNVRR